MEEFNWSVDSALFQLEHGTPYTRRFESALRWIQREPHTEPELTRLVISLGSMVANLKTAY